MNWKTKLLIERQMKRAEEFAFECDRSGQFEALVAFTIAIEKYKELMKDEDGE